MKKQVNLNSTEWCDMIFEGKNKTYGAYTLRQSSGKRHLVAFGLVVLFVVFLALLPSLIKAATPDRVITEGVEGPYTIIKIIEPLNDLVKPEMPAVPEVKFLAMDKFTPPLIVDDEDMVEGEEMKDMETLTKSKSVIGSYQVDVGSDDPDAIRKSVETASQIMGSGDGGGNQIASFVEVMPQFPGGEQELYKYIADNLRYPVADQEIGNQGRVVIRFVVDKAGTIRDAQILRGISHGCDREALRVVNSMPKWIPGRQNGNTVNVYFTLPIVFQIK